MAKSTASNTNSSAPQSTIGVRKDVKCPFPSGALSGSNQARIVAALEALKWIRVTPEFRRQYHAKTGSVLYSGSAETVLMFREGGALAEIGMWSVRIGQAGSLTTGQGAQHTPSAVTLIAAIDHSKVTGTPDGFVSALQGKNWRDA